MPDPGVTAFMDYWNGLPPQYVPQWEFAYGADDQLYAYPATPATQQQFRSRFTGEPVWGPVDVGSPTAQDLATDNVPGAHRVGGYPGANTDPQFTQDLLNWQTRLQAGNATGVL